MNTFVTQLRCPESLSARIKAAALANRRSMNSEILARLECLERLEARLGTQDMLRLAGEAA